MQWPGRREIREVRAEPSRGGSTRGGGRNRLCSVELCFEKIFPRRCGEPVRRGQRRGPQETS